MPDWAGHRAGWHVDIRLTAHDDYQAERAYSIASAPGEPLAITVEWLDDGEVSPCLAEESRTGELLEVRGPIGSYFVWEPGSGGPLLAVGGSGVVLLRAVLRHRSRTGSQVPPRLLWSSRSWGGPADAGRDRVAGRGRAAGLRLRAGELRGVRRGRPGRAGISGGARGHGHLRLPGFGEPGRGARVYMPWARHRVRCRACEAVLMTFVRIRGVTRAGLQGLAGLA